MPPDPIAVYHRTVQASLTRVWENVLDWEHLPWLHATTFASIRLQSRDTDGWRAESALRAAPDHPFVLEVSLDRPRLLYHARTIAGAGAGSDVVTRLEPLDAHTTRIAVEFLVPDVAPAQAPALGAAYVRLYTRLWDEDEAMMRRREAVVAGSVEAGTRTVTLEGTTISHAMTCPHWGGPLDAAAVDPDGCIACPWHGYRFDLRTGRQVGGPLRLPVTLSPGAPRR